MELKKTRQILKTLGDDTRLRILHLLRERPLSVSELTLILDTTQPNLSKHLAKLRLMNLVGDRREGMNVFYYLTLPKEKPITSMVQLAMDAVEDDAKCRRDITKLDNPEV